LFLISGKFSELLRSRDGEAARAGDESLEAILLFNELRCGGELGENSSAEEFLECSLKALESFLRAFSWNFSTQFTWS
jgi:hypothetical protein